MKILDVLLYAVLGALIAIAAGITYHAIEWVFARQIMIAYDDHTRGIWEGAVTLLVFEGGHKLAYRIMARRREERDQEQPSR